MSIIHSINLLLALVSPISLLSFCTGFPNVRIEDSKLESQIIESDFKVVRDIEFSSNGNLMLITGEVYASSGSGKVEIWDTGNWELIQTLETERASNRNAYFTSEDSQEILVLSASRNVSLWDTKTGMREKVLKEGSEQYRGPLPVDFSVPQHLLYFSSSEDILSLNIRTEEENVLASITDQAYYWHSIALSEKGSYLASYASLQYDSEDLPRVVHIFDVKTQENIFSIEAESNLILDIAFINDRYLVLAGVDGFLEIWNVETAEIVEDLSIETPLGYNSLASKRIDSMSDRNLFAVGSSAAIGTYSIVGEITLWDADSAEPLCSTGRMRSAAGVNQAVAISPDGQHLAGMEGGNVIVWDIEQCF